MDFTEFVGRHKEVVGLLFVWLILANLILLVDFFSYDPLLKVKTSYYYSHKGSRTIDGDVSFWNRNLKFGTTQFDKVFWDKYPVIYKLFTSRGFFVILVLLASLGVYIFFLSSRYGFGKSLYAALFYGVALRFLSYLPIWVYGWEIILMFIPWLFYAFRMIKHEGKLSYIVLLAITLYLSLLLFESDIIKYLVVSCTLYMFYSLVELLEFHHGLKYFFSFFLKISASVFLVLAASASRYLPLLSSRNMDIGNWITYFYDIKTLIVIIVGVGVLFLYKRNKKTIVFYIYCSILLLSVMFVVIYKLPWIKEMEHNVIPLNTNSDIIEHLSADSSSYRIYPLGKNYHDNIWTFNNESIGGKDNASNEQYDEVLNECLSAEIDKNLNINWQLLEMMNVKYIVSSVKIPSKRVSYKYYSPSEKLTLYEIDKSPQYAWFAEKWQYGENEDAMHRIKSPADDVINNVTVSKEISEFSDSCYLPEMKERKIDIERIDRGRITINTKTDSAGLLVISEPYEISGNWNAYIDSVETEIYQTNILLRSIVLPPGEHIVEMIYQMDMHRKWFRMSYWAGMLLLVILLSILIHKLAIEKKLL